MECRHVAPRQNWGPISSESQRVLLREWANHRWYSRPIRRLFRALPDLAVDIAHNGYRTGDRWLHGDSAFVDLEPAEITYQDITLEHAASGRSEGREQARLDYRRARPLSGIELWPRMKRR